MVTKSVETFVDVDVDLDDFNTDELIGELEDRGYTVLSKNDLNHYEDHISSLKEDFLNWYQFGMSNENFEKTMKQFFLNTIDEYIN